MKTKRILLIFLLSGIVLHSCKRYDVYHDSERIEVKFRSTIASQTKAADNAWLQNDEIGIFMIASGNDLTEDNIVENAFNRRYSTANADGFFTAASGNEVYFPVDRSKVDFVAYHPYQDRTDNMQLRIDVADQSNPLYLLYSDNAVEFDYRTSFVPLYFKHQLSKVIFNVKAGPGVSNVDNLSIKISNLRTSARFALKDASFTFDNTVRDVNLSMKTQTDGRTGEAVLIPADGMTDEVVFSLPSGDFKWNFEGTNFLKGRIYVYEVELRRTGGGATAVIVGATVNDWVTGQTEDITLDIVIPGDGSYDKPYLIEQLPTRAGETDKWITGYLSGVITDDGTLDIISTTFTQNMNVVLSSTPVSGGKTVTAEFDDGSTVQACLNLADNASLLKKKVKIRASIVAVAGSDAVIRNIVEQEGGVSPYYGWTENPARKSIKNAVFVMHYLPAPRNGMRNYSMLYDKHHKVAYWVAYPMHSTYLGSSERTNGWGYDPQIAQSDQAQLFSAFGVTDIDRGHQLPSADRTYSVAENQTTFYFTNMTPQHARLNQGVWATLEGRSRTWTLQCDTMYVVTGAMIVTENDRNVEYLNDNAGKPVALPKYYYKAFAKKIGNEYYTAAYKMNNEQPQTNVVANYRMKVSELEQETGFEFFPGIPKASKDVVIESMWQ